MEIREARTPDRPAIRDIARRSLKTSYSLDPRSITGAVSEWYEENRLKDMFSNDQKMLLVVDVDEQVVAFSDTVLTGRSTAQLLWLHVDPSYRGEGYGKALFEGTLQRLEERGITNIQGRVLADNAGGNAFYREQGLTQVGEEEVDIDGNTYIEKMYAEVSEEGIEPLETDGRTVHVDHNSTQTGSMAPFHVVYTERNGEDIYGYWCSRCEGLANAMDAMGRIQCDGCGNTRKPTRWDSAYL